ncbi:MAG: TrkA family potassium uptake protein [Vampirovibrionia bacterium]
MKKSTKNELIHSFLRILRPFVILFILALIGTIGFMFIEGLNTIDALYMTIISLTTVGYETVKPLTWAGKVFTCVYLLFSVVIFLYLASEFARRVISFNVKEILTKRQMDSRIKNLKNHYIICGFGRTGMSIASKLTVEGLEFVVVDNDMEAITEANSMGYLTVVGDSTDDEALIEAQVKNADGVFACLSGDADNLFVTIAAKDLNPELDIVVRCLSVTNKARFTKAGASVVVLPYTICGGRMVSSVVRPVVADFLDEALDVEQGLELKIEQIQLPVDSIVCGKSIIDAEIRPLSGAFVLAIKRKETFIHNPTSDIVLHPNDILIVLGSTVQLINLENIINQKGASTPSS